MIPAVLLPKWLTDEHAITVATWGLVFVTFLLVIATVVLWFDSWTKGREQRERWKLEDERRKQDHQELVNRWTQEDNERNEERAPHYRFGITMPEGGGVSLWVANMGQTTILWKSIWLEIGTPVFFDKLDPRPRWIEQMKTLPSGTLAEFKIPNEIYGLRGDLNVDNGPLFDIGVRCWVSLAGLRADITSPKKRFDAVVSSNGVLVSVSRNFGSDGIDP